MPTINFIEKYATVQNLDSHNHNYWEILYVSSGNGVFHFPNGEIIKYTKGDIICIPPHLPHKNSPSKDFSNIHLTLLNWTPSFHEPTLISNLESEDFHYVNDLYYILDLTYRQFHQPDQNQDILNNLTALLLSFIDALIKSPNISISSQVIESKICSNFWDPYFDLNAVYEEFPYSKRHLQRLFLKDYGVSPLQFLLNQKLNTAVKYLNQTIRNDYSIREIAERCGFSDQYYFSRSFKKQFGMSPKQYQKTKNLASATEKASPPP